MRIFAPENAAQAPQGVVVYVEDGKGRIVMEGMRE